MSTIQVTNPQTQLIVYREGIDVHPLNYQNELFECVFNQELFAHGMQNRQLKRQLRVLISKQALDFPAFRKIFPHLVEMTKPEKQISLVFELFKQFSQNPSEQICGRFFWFYYNGRHQNYRDMIGSLDNTMCMVTQDALSSSIYGVDSSGRLQHLWIDVTTQTSLAAAWTQVEKTVETLKTQPRSTFFTYNFAFESTFRSFPGHTFLAVQYLDRTGDIQYRLFQSYLDQYTLKDYLGANTLALTHAEFKAFFEGFEKCLLSDKWTDESKQFFITHFKAATRYVVGKPNPCKGRLKLEWGMGTIEDLLIQEEKFNSFKSSPLCPHIVAEYL